MAVYKVPQDVEADDTLIGPFSFRQFVFLLSMVGFLYFAYLMLQINIVLVAIPLPFIIFFAALAFPWRKDQPTEVYLTALIHFWLKPRKRIWNQEGHIEKVHITVPKKIEHQYTDGMSNTEVRSRLRNLAATLDSHGWDSKHVNINDLPAQGMQMPMQQPQQSDRLAMPVISQPAANQAYSISASDDVMDVNNNPVAQNFNQLVNKSTEDRRAQAVLQMQQAAAAAPQQNDEQSNLSYNPYPDMQQSVVAPGGKMEPEIDTSVLNQSPPVNPEAQGAIINLANNSDLNVSTIARQADQAMSSGDTIELH